MLSKQKDIKKMKNVKNRKLSRVMNFCEKPPNFAKFEHIVGKKKEV